MEVNADKTMCPSAGYHPFMDNNCSPAFIKCKKRDDGMLEGTVYRCPNKYSYWSVSRRCERTEKLPNCQKTRLNQMINGAPVEWVNLGKARQLIDVRY